jgi:signal transduction histidine kinase
MDQVFMNIAKNALEAMPPHGLLEVQLRHPEGADYVEVEFSDNGPGIPQSILDQVFEPFFTTKKAGTGLGLPLCKSIIENLGGTLSIRNRKPRGVTVLVTLPLAPDGGEQPEPHAGPTRSVSRRSRRRRSRRRSR